MYTTYNCDSLIGGGSRCLDGLSVVSLADKDRAICAVGSQFFYFVYDADGTAVEQTSTHPYVIRPDDYSVGGNWVEFEASGIPSDIPLPESVQFATSGTLTADKMNGSTVGNIGQTNDLTVTLAPAFEGAEFTVVLGLTVAKYFRLDPNASDKIFLNGTAGANGEYVGVASALSGYAIVFKAFELTSGTFAWFASAVCGPWLAE